MCRYCWGRLGIRRIGVRRGSGVCDWGGEFVREVMNSHNIDLDSQFSIFYPLPAKLTITVTTSRSVIPVLAMVTRIDLPVRCYLFAHFSTSIQN
jgi:hypothetical protein